MATDRQNRIAEYMNSQCRDRQFTGFDVGLIESAISDYRKSCYRRNYKRTKDILAQHNLKTAQLIDMRYRPEDIRLCKKCTALEYQDRTGKCAWGFREKRTQLGYDPDTGLEKEES